MAIKVAGTEVISDSRELTNVTGATVSGSLEATRFTIGGEEVINASGEYVGSIPDSSLNVGGSLVGPLSDAAIQYGTSYSGTPQQGSMYFDSLNQKLQVYTGASFVDAVPAGTGSGTGELTDANTTFRKYTYEITASTNAVSGVDAEGETLTYVTDGTENVEVFVNGVKQVEGGSRDYVASTGSAVTFTYNLPVGSVVDIQVYEFLSNDAYYVKSEVYTKAETNTQITTATSAYLPLSGGALTDSLNIISSGATGANNTEVLRLSNNATSFGGDGLSVYNASTGYDSVDTACLTYYARGAGGSTNILTEVGNSITESVTDHRYVATDSSLSLNIPLKYETYFAYNGNNMSVSADQKLTEIRGSGQTGSVSIYGEGRLIASKLGVGLTSPATLVNFYNGGSTIGAADGVASMANATLLIGSTLDGIGFDNNEIVKTGAGELYVSSASGLDLRGNLGTRSLYVHSDGNVKVGTGTPTHKLHAYQASTIGDLTAPVIENAVLRVQDESFSLYMDGNAIVSTVATSAMFQIGTSEESDLQLLTGSARRLTIKGSSGSVGIHTDNPQARLHVDDIEFPGPAPSGSINNLYVSNAGTSNVTSAFQVNTSGGLGISSQNSGRTGFGTATPSAKVDINGALAVSSTANSSIKHHFDTAAGDYVVHRYIGSDGGTDNYVIGYGPTHSTSPGHMAIKANTANGVIGFYNGATSTERVAIEVSGKLRINDGTVKFQDVTNPAELGGVVIAMAQGAVANVTPTTGKGGFAHVVLFNTTNGINFNYPQTAYSGIMFYDIGPSPSGNTLAGGSDFVTYSNASLFTGTETANKLHISAKAGYLNISNQYATPILLRFIFT